MGNKTILNNFSIITIITAIEKVLSFIFEALIAAILGAGVITDSYFSSAELFTLIDSTILGALTIALLNRFSKNSITFGEKVAFDKVSNIQAIVIPMMFLLGIIIFVFASPISYVIAPGFNENGRVLIIRCIKILAILPTILSVTAIRLAILRQKKRFGITCLKSLCISIVGIVALIIFGHKAINSDFLCYSFLISSIVFCGICSLSTKEYGRIKLIKPGIDEDAISLMKLTWPLIISNGIIRVSLMVDRILASTLQEGSVSYLSYSHALHNFVTAFFVTNLCTILLTEFNNLFVIGEIKAIKEKINNAISIILLVLVPITIISFIYSEEIVSIVYERGAFSGESVIAVADLLAFYSLNFIPCMFYNVYNHVLYATGDTKFTMNNSIISIICNIIASISLVSVIGLRGIAIGTVISSVVGAVLSYRDVKKTIVGYTGILSKNFLIKLFTAVIIASCATFALHSFFIINKLFSFILATIACCVVFYGSLFVTREKNTIDIIKKFLSFKHLH